MRKLFLCGFMFLFVGFSVYAQFQSMEASPFSVTGNLTTIYTLGNAATDQMLNEGTGPGAFEEFKNGHFVESNVFVRFNPVPFFEGFFKIYAISRPGSFYIPLSLEGKSTQNLGLSLDRVYGRINVFEALELNLPVDLFLKAGKYKGEAARFQNISGFGLENVLHRMETANTFNFEVEAAMNPFDDDFRISAAFITNSAFDEAIPRLYDIDGGVSRHGEPVLGEHAPQFFTYLRASDLALGSAKMSAEIVYAQNASDIYSGNSFGGSFRFTLPLSESFTLPIGLGVVYHEKNIDLLGRSAIYGAANQTVSFRDSFSAALSVGARLDLGSVSINGNLAGVFSSIEHIYRDPLTVISASADVEVSFNNRYFIGGGIVAGSITDARWQTKENSGGIDYGALDNGGFDHTFTFADNLGFEVYVGMNLWNNCRFVIGFNQNRGISMNHNLETKTEGQMKYQLAGSSVPGSFESGGLFIKLAMSW